MTEQVEKGTNRINIEKDGFIIENDAYFQKESLHFTTDPLLLNYNFKYPNADDGDIINGDENYTYITSFMNILERELMNIPGDCESYKRHLDISSFARWYIVEELLANLDPNIYYVLPSRNGKLKMMPCWDAEWSLGLASKGNKNDPYGWYKPPYKPKVDIEVWSKERYFPQLFKDPEFVSEVRRQWNEVRSSIPNVVMAIGQRENDIRSSQEKNFKIWPILDEYVGAGLIALGSWEAEVKYVADFFQQRVAWIDAKWCAAE